MKVSDLNVSIIWQKSQSTAIAGSGQVRMSKLSSALSESAIGDFGPQVSCAGWMGMGRPATFLNGIQSASG